MTYRHDRGKLLVITDQSDLLSTFHKRNERNGLQDTLSQSVSDYTVLVRARATHLGTHRCFVDKDDREIDKLFRCRHGCQSRSSFVELRSNTYPQDLARARAEGGRAEDVRCGE